jgi:hypothetical protein
LPLFNVQEVSRGGICDVGERQPGRVPMGIRRGIRRAIRILSEKREVLLQQVRLPACLTDSGKITEVVLGTVDGDPGMRPGEHIFVGSKAPWYEIADALPQFEEWPPGMGH